MKVAEYVIHTLVEIRAKLTCFLKPRIAYFFLLFWI